MKLVILESPYAGDVEANEAYARRAMLDCIKRGEAPFVSHLLYTQVLDDMTPEQRALGMEAGWAWMKVADYQVCYVDHGISGGMRAGMDRARSLGLTTICRKIRVELCE